MRLNGEEELNDGIVDEEYVQIPGPDGKLITVKRIYITNQNYEEYYRKKEKEVKEKIQHEEISNKVRQKAQGGRKGKPLMQAEIESVQMVAKSARECARLLSVSYPTYKKYAKMYGIFEKVKNESGKGLVKVGSGRKPEALKGTPHKNSLEFLLEGGNPSYPQWRLKKRLLSSGYLPKCCSNCGYDEMRVTDHKVPLLLDYMDGNKKNHRWENLRMLCYNCWYQINGDLFGRAMRNVKRDVWDYQYIHK